MSTEQAVYGAHQIAASNMILAIKAVSTERGCDPREFALFAFAAMARSSSPAGACARHRPGGGPASAGLFSSFGLLYADVEHHYSRTSGDCCAMPTGGDPPRRGVLADQAMTQLAIESFRGARALLHRSAAFPLPRQTYELTVSVPDRRVDARMVAHVEEPFGTEHERTY